MGWDTLAVPVVVSQVEFGPHITPPVDWHPEHRPDELGMFRGKYCAIYEAAE